MSDFKKLEEVVSLCVQFNQAVSGRVSADSDLTPLGFGAYSSRVTLMGGNASKMAGDEVRNQVLKSAAEIMKLDESKLKIF